MSSYGRLRRMRWRICCAVMDQESRAVKQAGEAEIARLLGYPVSGGVGCAAGEVHAAALELDEEEHVEAAERERLDGEEIASEHGCGLLAQKLVPAQPRAPRRGRDAVGEQDASNRARRDTRAKLAQLAGDPRVAPARVLTREAQHELAHPVAGRRTARSSLGLRPFSAHKLPVPAQERLRPHHQAVAPARWQQADERRE
jgi:hypothetical protein